MALDLVLLLISWLGVVMGTNCSSAAQPLSRRWAIRTAGGWLLAAMALALVGCSSAAPASLPSHSSNTSSSTNPTAAASALPVDAEPSPEATAAGASTDVADTALAAYCRPTLPKQRWLDALTPYLTQDAAAAYATVDPAHVPCRKFRGAGRVVDGDGAFTMHVAAGTDVGTYTVWLSRPGAGRPWRVDRFIPPAPR